MRDMINSKQTQILQQMCRAGPIELSQSMIISENKFSKIGLNKTTAYTCFSWDG